jgi:hypothetical protein
MRFKVLCRKVPEGEKRNFAHFLQIQIYRYSGKKNTFVAAGWEEFCTEAGVLHPKHTPMHKSAIVIIYSHATK